MQVIEICHLDEFGKILWKKENVLNLLHLDGEEFLLRAAFTGGRVSTIVPDNYFIGLDNRQNPSVSDTIDNLIGEPSFGGYQRQQVSSSGDFSINFENSHFVATSPIVAFRSTTGSWGPVSKLFITDKNDNSGYLISTANLDAPLLLDPGRQITVRIGMRLRCP